MEEAGSQHLLSCPRPRQHPVSTWSVCYKIFPLRLVGTQTVWAFCELQGVFHCSLPGLFPWAGRVPHMHVLISSQLKIQGSPICLSRGLSSLGFRPASSLWPPRILNMASSTHRDHQALSGLLLLPPRATVCKLYPGSRPVHS